MRNHKGDLRNKTHIQQLFRHLGKKIHNLHILLADYILACQLTNQGPYVNMDLIFVEMRITKKLKVYL